MPLFYSTTSAQRMPLTSPETYGGVWEKSYPSKTAALQPSMGSQKPSNSSYSSGDEKYNAAATKYCYQQPAISRPSYFLEPKVELQPAYPGSPHTNLAQYRSTHVPGLPPIQPPGPLADNFGNEAPIKHITTANQEKEEKIGGVAAHLDYEMEVMVDFVSEMAQGMYSIFASKICLADIDMTRSILSSKSQPRGDFRRYVSQVLSSTRLPSSTILLALLYLSRRMTFLSKKGYYGQSARDVYSMLTTALILGSKFLDDNTFQNRSWSEVSHIAVTELNGLELQWLADMDWDLHIDQDDSEGFPLWLLHWNRFRARKDDTSLVTSMMRTSLDGSVPRRHQQGDLKKLPSNITHGVPRQLNAFSQPAFVNDNRGPWNTPQRVGRQQTRARTDYSPPSAPETGPNTPDAFGAFNSSTYAHQSAHAGFGLPPPLHTIPSNSPPAYLKPYTPQYSHYPQGSFRESSFCAFQQDRYFMAPAYGYQSVAA